MKLYNQLTKKIETFEPEDPNAVKVYTCGPTVYSYAHIGNLASYVYWDLLVRVLEREGYRVNRVMNITDVGHLASDADEGEDKLEKGARKEGKTVWEVAKFYEEAFLSDFDKLHLSRPAEIARATDFISQEMALVDLLAERGYTYEIADGIYFDTSKFPTYADFARLDLENLQAGARVGFNSEKKNVSDFAVWKFVKEGEDHAMQWEYRGRPGYPGWHLECSAIIHELLKEPIDIHAGGIDHIPVHNTNEIAQSEAAYGAPLSRFWLHCKHIMIENQKISKSLGNVYLLSDLENRGFTALDFKMWVLQGHFQGERNFSFEDLTAAKTRRLSWRNLSARAAQKPAVSDFNAEEFHDLLANNLNSPDAFAYIDTHALSRDDWNLVDEYFDLGLRNSDAERIAEELKPLIEKREEARTAKDYETADQVRAEIEERGFVVLDTEDGPIWQFKA